MVLVALEVLLLCLRMLYFGMAYEHLSALLRMVLTVIKARGRGGLARARTREGLPVPVCEVHVWARHPSP